MGNDRHNMARGHTFDMRSRSEKRFVHLPYATVLPRPAERTWTVGIYRRCGTAPCVLVHHASERFEHDDNRLPVLVYMAVDGHDLQRNALSEPEYSCKRCIERFLGCYRQSTGSGGRGHGNTSRYPASSHRIPVRSKILHSVHWAFRSCRIIGNRNLLKQKNRRHFNVCGFLNLRSDCI